MKYYVIQAYKKKVDLKYKKHLNPSYISFYNSKDSIMIQSNIYDCTKFKSLEKLRKALKRINKSSLNKIYYFTVVDIDSRIFGKDKHRWVE